MTKEEKIFDLKINCYDYPTIENSITLALQKNKQIAICYANFFSVTISKKNPIFLSIINSMDLIFPDGTGIWLGSKIIGNHSIEKKFNLTDNGLRFLDYLSRNHLPVFMFGGEAKILEASKIKIQSLYSGISIKGMLHGYSDNSDVEILEMINRSNSTVLMVGLGTPKQEEWIYSNRMKINSRIIISVGDLFSLFAGTKRRGFSLIQSLGLEWLIRLISKPRKYYRRYLLGIPIYLIILFKEYFGLGKKS